MSICAIIVAAGRGSRAGGAHPKQWQRVAGRPVACWTVQAYLNHPLVDQVVVVVHPDDPVETYLGDLSAKILTTHGAATREGSVVNGLDAVPDGTTHVLIHDVARPCISAALISDVITALRSHDCAAPALAVSDALWQGRDGCVAGIQDRTGLYRAQTPQGFALHAIRTAHASHKGPAADDVAIARAAGLDVTIVSGDEANLKITVPADFDRAARHLESMMDIRTGNGFDVHRFGAGDHVTLCGLAIPHDRGLQGHSDADVALHTITDAIYGALAAGDIGQHFPPTDPRWKGAASHIFLEHARDMARDAGFSITHVDCTLICEHPKIGPHATAMRENLAALLGLDLERVSVKATTSEKLGFTGRGEGIACQATATLVKP